MKLIDESSILKSELQAKRTNLSLIDKITFGKYRGDTIKEIIDNAPTYIEWALDEVDWFELDDEAMAEYERAIAYHYQDYNEDNDSQSRQLADW